MNFQMHQFKISRRSLSFMIIIGGLLLSGCSPSDSPNVEEEKTNSGKLKIVTTCGMVTDIVKQIVGDKADVEGLMNSSVDPHLHVPNREDSKKLLEADVVFYSGLMLEGRMVDTFMNISRKGKLVFPVTEALDKDSLREPPEFEGHWDPHVWMNVDMWRLASEYVAKKMGEVDVRNADFYLQNSLRYSEELKKLDEYALKSISSIAEPQRILITAHDAFGYFGEAYGLEVRGVQGFSTESAAGVDDINKLVDYIVENKIKAIFVESSVSPSNIKALIEGAGSKGWEVKVGGTLFSDAMGTSGTYEGTYIGMIDHNVTVITHSLGGTAPKGGLNGKLSPTSTEL